VIDNSRLMEMSSSSDDDRVALTYMVAKKKAADPRIGKASIAN